jgi:hypothetical protein
MNRYRPLLTDLWDTLTDWGKWKFLLRALWLWLIETQYQVLSGPNPSYVSHIPGALEKMRNWRSVDTNWNDPIIIGG